MDEDNEIFKKTALLLEENNINYWVCHGTLLGIIRENRLLPWDHDIDFAVWADEVSKEEMVEMFLSSGYTQEIIMDEYDNLFFSTNNKRVDINFYRRDGDMAFAKWVSPTANSSLVKLYYFIVSELIYTLDIKRIEDSTGVYKGIKWVIIKATSLIKPLIPKYFKHILYTDVVKRLKYTGYSYPVDLMKFKKIDFMDIKISVPINVERYLENTYGSDWRVPKKNYIWFNEAKNLLDH